MDVAADAARPFLVTRQMLAPARSVEGGPDGVLVIFRRLGSIQFDPLSVAGRNHDLVLHARVAGYDPAWCDALYERRELFEAYNKGLSLVPTSDFPWFRATLSVNSPRILAEHPDVAEYVLERIRAEGPLSALDFERQRGSLVDWFGAPHERRAHGARGVRRDRSAMTVLSSSLPRIPFGRPAASVPTALRSRAEPVQSASHSRRVDMPSSLAGSGGAVISRVVVSRRSREEAPAASLNSPASSIQSFRLVDQ
jgi:hypothetical protein